MTIFYIKFNLCTGVFRSWAPKLYEYYDDRLGKLFEDDEGLKKPFNSVFPAVTYNLGPQTVCTPHLDFANLPFGYCAITALGQYDPTKGGHLVLWECKLVIEFPPGSTILIPSAIVTHSNVPIRAGEKRYSVTQYSAGALFRWVDNGFQTAVAYRASLTAEEKIELEETDSRRWELGLDLLPKLDRKRKAK